MTSKTLFGQGTRRHPGSRLDSAEFEQARHLHALCARRLARDDIASQRLHLHYCLLLADLLLTILTLSPRQRKMFSVKPTCAKRACAVAAPLRNVSRRAEGKTSETPDAPVKSASGLPDSPADSLEPRVQDLKENKLKEGTTDPQEACTLGDHDDQILTTVIPRCGALASMSGFATFSTPWLALSCLCSPGWKWLKTVCVKSVMQSQLRGSIWAIRGSFWRCERRKGVCAANPPRRRLCVPAFVRAGTILWSNHCPTPE